MFKHILFSLALIAAAILVRLWAAPLLERLPLDYSSETIYSNDNQLRNTPDAEWKTAELTARRVDQAIAVNAGALMVQAGLHLYYEDGSPNFETSSLYAVDRRTRMNLPGLGEVSRTGQFLFPLHVHKTSYNYWDPIYIGPRTALFDHEEKMDGLLVYVFQFTVKNLDETAGFSYLPDVPERYLALTNAAGTLWIEPVSGIVVDYSDQGKSSFINKATMSPVAEFSRWDERYTPETHLAQLRLARSARLGILVMEIWLPAGLVLAGMVWIIIKSWYLRSMRKENQ
jgi:hypothetical protein